MDKNSNKELKKLVLLLLLFVGLGASVTAGAYWASSFTVNAPAAQATGTVNVTIGQGETITVSTNLNAVTAEAGDTDVLIPNTITAGDGETHTKSFTVTATWSTETTGTVGIVQSGTISVVEDSVVIEGLSSADSESLNAVKALFIVTITPESGTIQLGQEPTFTVTVTMTEPANKAQYEIVKNANITITFKLKVVL